MSNLYNTAFRVNAASLILYKSRRKNARCSDIISINHLISHEENKRITDERILDQFIGTLEKVVYTALEYHQHLEFTVRMDYGKNTTYAAVSGQYSNWESLRYYWERVQFSSIEQAINFLYSVYSLVYPYNELNLENTVYNNASVKYLINKFYRGGSNNEQI